MAKTNAVPAPFAFESHAVRTTVENDEIWFTAKDVAFALGYTEASIQSGALFNTIPDEWKGHKRIMTLKGEQKLTCISEQGLYFFLGRSDKPKTLPFQKWVYGEVLPSIRKTGSYTQTISTAQQGELATLIAERFPDGKSRPYAWSRFNNHFRLSSYKTLPAERFNEACEYIRTMPLTSKEQTAEKILSNTQLLMTVDHNGKISLREISCIYDKLPELIGDPQHKGLSNKTILRIADACIKALAYREGHNLKAISSALSL